MWLSFKIVSNDASNAYISFTVTGNKIKRTNHDDKIDTHPHTCGVISKKFHKNE